MLAKSNPEGHSHLDQTGHPVIRTLYDHLEVSDSDFITKIWYNSKFFLKPSLEIKTKDYTTEVLSEPLS